MNVFVKTNLYLLRNQLSDLSKTPYFDKSLEAYLESLIKLVDHHLSNYDNQLEQISRQLVNRIWCAFQYLNGSTSNEIPYETVYSLKIVLRDWNPNQQYAVTTALIDKLNYHFNPVDPSHLIKIIKPDFNIELIQIALPRLYKNKPLYNVALYHELGHFVDKSFNIVGQALLFQESSIYSNHPVLSQLPIEIKQEWEKLDSNAKAKIEKSHLEEYFADLFAASYTGNAISRFLKCVAPDALFSCSHPATEDRLKIINSLVNGYKDPLIDLFNKVLSTRNLTPTGIEKRFSIPDIQACYNNIRPYTINNDNELHGILEAGWELLEKAQTKQTSPWKEFDEFEIEKIINDLTEKSIRNRMIVCKWNHGTS